MAGAFSGRLVDSFHAQQARYSVPVGSPATQLITSGAMSFNPQMHGTPVMGNQSMGDFSFSFNSPHSTFNPELSEATTLRIAALQAKLNQKLGPEYISQRPGPGGGPKLTYAEGWKIINLANEVFGFNGWSSSVVSLTTDFIDYNEESKRFNVGTTAVIRVTLRDGVFHEDIGYGVLENSKSKGAALDKCKKEAVTDGLKRALRNFGNLLGNCLYDKAYTQEVVKIKVPPAKFEKSELYRRPEFEETKPNIASTSKPTLSSASSAISANNATSNFVTPTRPAGQPPQQQTTVPPAMPSHLRPAPKPADPDTSLNNRPLHSTSSVQPSVAGPSNPVRAHQTMDMRRTTSVPPSKLAHAAKPRENACASSSYDIKPTSHDAPSVQAPAAAAADPQPTDEAADESYHFYSDDDAFLAMVDLGEGDLGQPLLPETDLGRPIDGDEDGSDVRRAGGEKDQQPSPVNSAEETRQKSAGVLSGLLPQNQPHAQQQDQRSSNHLNPPNKPLPPQQQHQNHNQQQHRPPHNHQPQRNHPQQHHNQNQNQHQNHSHQSGSGADVAKRPSTPSTGGFHFPPGVDPRAEQSKQAVPPPQPLPHGQVPASRIGLKRPLDAMSSSTTVMRSGMGMGANGRLTGAGASAGQAQVKREVFGSLEIGEGGDVKRPRR